MDRRSGEELRHMQRSKYSATHGYPCKAQRSRLYAGTESERSLHNKCEQITSAKFTLWTTETIKTSGVMGLVRKASVV